MLKKSFLVASGLAMLIVLATWLHSPVQAASNNNDKTKSVQQAAVGGKARNVILFIGDGMGDSEITIAATIKSAPPDA